MPVYPRAGDMLKATYDPDDDGRIEKEAMDWALNKLLEGAGDGVNPTEINVPTSLYFTECFIDKGNPTNADVWEDLDLSGDVPAGTLWVLLSIYANTAAHVAGIRKNGSATNRRLTFQDADYFFIITELDATRKCERWAGDLVSGCGVYVWGYWS